MAKQSKKRGAKKSTRKTSAKRAPSKAKKTASRAKPKRSQASNTRSSKKKLYRSQKDKVIGGVCGGLAQYFNVDVVFIRVLAAVLVLANGFGILLYLVLWLTIPSNPKEKSTKPTHAQEMVKGFKKRHRQSQTFTVGVILVILGVALLFDGTWFSTQRLVWAVILAGIGVVLINKK